MTLLLEISHGNDEEKEVVGWGGGNRSSPKLRINIQPELRS